MTHVLLDDQGTGQQMVFRDPHRIIRADARADLLRAFAEIDRAQAEGKWLAGWLSYELGHALEGRFDPPNAPLIRLGVFDAPTDHPPVDWLYTRDVPDIDFQPVWSEDDYLIRFEKVQTYLRAGDVYQINLTFPMFTQSEASATQLYAAFRQRQPGRYGAVVDLDETQIISFSPELFFERRGRDMRMRPMKGTRPRSADAASDAALLAQMRAEPKSQAENLMIVDLLRNDLSRLCEPGSVAVPELFALETYPTLHQMTSQVTGRLRDGVGWAEILRGLFPCGSITGAPKIRAMEIIEELESGPRGAYCGSVGYIAPDGDASFNVAIRTIQKTGNRLRYDVGSGVVLDSEGPDEYRECLLKAELFKPMPTRYFTTALRDETGRIPYKDRHAVRLAKVSAYSDEEIAAALSKAEAEASPARLKLLAGPEGIELEVLPLSQDFLSPSEGNRPTYKVAISRYALTETVQRIDAKTTARDFYDGERARVSAQGYVDDVLFLNAAGELAEGSITSVFVEIDGQLYTPPLSAGLLPGILRAELIETGRAEERKLFIDDLMRADALFIGNALRGLQPATLISPDRL